MTGQRQHFTYINTAEVQMHLVETNILLPCSLELIVHASSNLNVISVGSLGFQDR